MNKIKELLNGISDGALTAAVKEIHESEKTGIIPENGLVREYAGYVGELTDGHLVTDYFMVTIGLLKVAAYRWAKIN